MADAPVRQDQDAPVDILIVEDSATQLARLRFYLERNGFSVRATTTGVEAVAALEEAIPAAVVSDVVMPEMGGYDLCRAVRNDERWAHLPVILLTALTGAADVIDGLASGASDFLVKPYTEEALVTRLNRALNNAALRAEGSATGDVEVWFAGRCYTLHSDRSQSIDFLLSSFEDAVTRNAQLNEANASLKDALGRISNLEKRFQNLMEFSPAGLLVVGGDGMIWYANKAAEDLFRRDAEDLKGTLFPFVLETGAAAEVTLSLPGHTQATAEMRVVETTWGDSPAFLVSMWDVTENVLLRQQLEDLSLTDELTGLANRRGFMILAEQQRKLVKRGHAIVMLYMDVNDFKTINDTLGHNVGDRALTQTARLLETCVRDSDLLARMGGDEFAALLVDSEEAFAARAPLRIKEAFGKHNGTANEPYKLSISVGTVLYVEGDVRSLEELIERADRAMYDDKEQMKRSATGPLSGIGTGRS